MSAISTILTRLRAAIWAIDVRDDIANAIEQCYSDVSNPTLQTEALEAALQEKIDQGEVAALTIGDGTITGAKLANGTIPKAKLDPSITFDADAALDPTSTNAIQNKVVASELATVKADLGDCTEVVQGSVMRKTYTPLTFSMSNATTTRSGITFSQDTNKKATAVGTASANSTYMLVDNNNAALAINLSAGKTYRLRGCPSGGEAGGYRLDIRDAVSNGNVIGIDYGDGIIFTVENGGNHYLFIRITSGKTVNLEFEPEVAEESEVEVEGNLLSAIDVQSRAGLSALEERVDSFSGSLTPEIIEALLACFAHVGWEYPEDRQYCDALAAALYAENVTRIEATLTLGSHDVYNTDSVEALRNFLTVEAFYPDGTSEEVTDYTLEGIYQIGTNTITIKYGHAKRTTVSVPVIANPSGIVYEWDFTKGLRDVRQGQLAILHTGEKDIDPTSTYEGYTPPALTASGVSFTNKSQCICLLDTSFNTNNLFGKTVQVDVESFDCKADYINRHVRFIMFCDPAAKNETVMTRGDGVVYRMNTGWSFYDGYSWKNEIYSGMSGVNAISGKLISAYFGSSGAVELCVDGVSKGTSQAQTVNNHTWKGLYIGDASWGGYFYNALVSGVRIYNGRVVE